MSMLKTTLALALGAALTLPFVAKADDKAPAKDAAAAAAATKTAKADAKAAKATKADAKTAKADPTAEALMKKSDCFTCHQVAKKVVGPSYKDVAKKYKGDAKAEDKLAAKVKTGGSGNWGQVPMAGHPNLKDEDIHAMVRWVLAQK